MAKLTGNTVLTRPGTLDLVFLAAGDDVPDWADGLVGNHLLATTSTTDTDQGDTDAAAGGTPDASWTVADLREWAKTNNVDLDGATAKADILTAING